MTFLEKLFLPFLTKTWVTFSQAPTKGKMSNRHRISTRSKRSSKFTKTNPRQRLIKTTPTILPTIKSHSLALTRSTPSYWSGIASYEATKRILPAKVLLWTSPNYPQCSTRNKGAIGSEPHLKTHIPYGRAKHRISQATRCRPQMQLLKSHDFDQHKPKFIALPTKETA